MLLCWARRSGVTTRTSMGRMNLSPMARRGGRAWCRRRREHCCRFGADTVLARQNGRPNLPFRLQGYSVNPIQRDCPPATNGLLGPGQSFQIVLPVATLAGFRSDDSRIATVLLSTFQPTIDRRIPGRGVSRRRTPVHVVTYLTTSWGEHMPMWPNELITLLRIAYWPGETSGVPLESLRGGNPGGNCAAASQWSERFLVLSLGHFMPRFGYGSGCLPTGQMRRARGS